ncbi:PRC-barrel domain containing protein [Arsenicitalea aurantiaca]|uniref:PRC-barrel domain containing protein n=1 Tax=Arsenicitalea aurantiaca TaxID=1783274 RepID=A0A433X1U5_9HYPH|nr:PRC-barrel domain-containing protein [Arsenicitalea aurantiaca]RUT28084.1 PRC-barrel domain containing protein [Arsenicitalea aurantiaca]
MVANQSIRGVKIGRRFPRLWGQFCTPIHRGDEEGCAYIVGILDQTYQDYAARLDEAGVEPANVTNWRQEQLALAQPVGESEELQRLNVDNITGTDVRNLQDENLGSVSDIVIDPRTGQVTYAVVARGGFLGFGEEHVAVPWNQFRATPGLNTLVLDVTTETLEQAPAVDPNTFGDPASFAQQDEQIGQFWNRG